MSFKDKILKNQSPWGSPPGGGGQGSPGGNGSGTRQDPPNLDDIIRNLQKTVNKFSGGKSGGSRPIIIGLMVLVLLYLASGLYRVLPDEQGVVLRFGKYVKTTQPGRVELFLHIFQILKQHLVHLVTLCKDHSLNKVKLRPLNQ